MQAVGQVFQQQDLGRKNTRVQAPGPAGFEEPAGQAARKHVSVADY